MAERSGRRQNGWRRRALIGLGLLVGSSGSLAARCDPVVYATAVVAAAGGGDRLKLDDGSEVVLIGALPPQVGASQGASGDGATAAAQPWPPAEATRRELEALLAGRTVQLASAGPRIDRYGRHLAQVFVARDGERIWVQVWLVAHGLARAYALPGSDACVRELLASEAEARAARRGHWAAGGVFADRDGGDPAGLLALRDTFQTVVGQVASAGVERGRQVLIFSSSRARALRVAVAGRAAAGKGGRREPRAAGLDALAGHRVRVRGWIDVERRGPQITVETADMIELIDGPGPGDDAGAADADGGTAAPIPAAAR